MTFSSSSTVLIMALQGAVTVLLLGLVVGSASVVMWRILSRAVDRA